MKKLLLLATIAFMTALLFSGIYAPNSPLMWLASTDPGYAYIRAGIIAVLIVLFATNPPRSLHFRASLGVFSAALFGMAVYMTWNFTMPLVDGLAFIEVAAVCAIEALEMETLKLTSNRLFVARAE